MVALLALSATGRAFRRADRLGVLEAVLPEIAPMRRAPQPAPHRFDVLEHSLRAVEACDRVLGTLDALEPFGEELAAHVSERLGGALDRGRVLKLAALLHDVSKPETRRVVDGRVHFYEHDRDRGRAARAPSVSACGCPSGRSPSSSAWSASTCVRCISARRGR